MTAETRIVGWCWEDDWETEVMTTGRLIPGYAFACRCGLFCETVRVYVGGRLVEEISPEEYEARMAQYRR